MSRGLDLAKERAQQDGTEWRFGAMSAPGLIAIPLEDRPAYLPKGERQNIGEEKNDCATRAPINSLEEQLNYGFRNKLFKPANLKFLEQYLEDGRIVLSDRFIAIKSGTDPLRGNSLKAPHQAIRTYGVIPKRMFPQVASRAEYYDASRITPAMEALGREFADRFTVNYEQVDTAHIPYLLKDEDGLTVALYAWPKPATGVYPRVELDENHAAKLFDPKILCFDNYEDWNAQNTAQVPGDFIKHLAKDYRFYPYAYRIFISAENENIGSRFDIASKLLPLLQALLTLVSLGLYAPKTNEAPQPVPEPIPAPEPPSPPTPAPNPGDLLHQAALSFLGKDASPQDHAPDELGCVDSFQQVYKAAFGSAFSTTLSTAQLYKDFSRSTRVLNVPLQAAKAGDIILCPTGHGTNPAMPHGHVGIIGEAGTVMSNDSATGKWMQNYSVLTWTKYFGVKGGYPVFIFRPIASA